MLQLFDHAEHHTPPPQSYVAPQHIIAEARDWIGTAFLHQGRRKRSAQDKGGVDCLGLLMGVAATLHLHDKHGQPFIRHDTVDYSKQPDAARMLHDLCAAMECIPQEQMRPGDVLLLRIDAQPQHLAFLAEPSTPHSPPMQEECTIIHAYAPAKQVIEHRLDAHWREAIAAVFRLPQTQAQPSLHLSIN